MVTEYKTVFTDAFGEITEKKSRFIAVIHHVENEIEASDFISLVKKEHWDARHNCFAYVIGTDFPTERSSDDGEPSRTAGLPILEAVKGAGLTNVCIAVTRYFGGILLGTGPLAKAYRDSAGLAIANAGKITVKLLSDIQLSIDYDLYGKLKFEADRLGLKVTDTQFSDRVLMRLALTGSETEHIRRYLNDASRGTCDIQNAGQIWVRC